VDAPIFFIGHGSERTTERFASSRTDETDGKALPMNELAKFSAHPMASSNDVLLSVLKTKKYQQDDVLPQGW
jgi:hypothetical protein